MKDELKIPKEVSDILENLQSAGYEAFIVGGCVRDLLRGEKPKDWDVTTSAKPEEIQKIFPDSFYENKFLTVTAKTESEDPTLKEIEITTFRAEGKYTDKRHPDEVRFVATLEEDLSRRDFTINAIALALIEKKQAVSYKLIDPFDGKGDIKKKLIRAVGEPEKRFNEDALRMMRAVRLAVQLDFRIEPNTFEAIKKEAGSLRFIAKERIRDELIKIFDTPRAKEGIELLHDAGLLKFIIPELEEGIGVTQNKAHAYKVWEHNLIALDYAAKQNFPLDVRIAALFHDIGKPRVKEGEGPDSTFYGHDIVGGKMSAEILERLHFPKDRIEKIVKLVRWHLFKHDDTTTDSYLRRLFRRVGVENMIDLVRVRMCDRVGTGVPKTVPYQLRNFQFRVEKVMKEEEAPTPKMLKVNGEDIMRILKIRPGPKVGRIIEVLMQDVLDEPSKNTRENLELRIKNLGKLTDEELAEIAEDAEKKVEMVEDERISELKAKYYVK